MWNYIKNLHRIHKYALQSESTTFISWVWIVRVWLVNTGSSTSLFSSSAFDSKSESLDNDGYSFCQAIES